MLPTILLPSENIGASFGTFSRLGMTVECPEYGTGAWTGDAGLPKP